MAASRRIVSEIKREIGRKWRLFHTASLLYTGNSLLGKNKIVTPDTIMISFTYLLKVNVNTEGRTPHILSLFCV